MKLNIGLLGVRPLAAPVVTCCGAQQGDASASPLSFALDHSLLLLLVYSSLALDTNIIYNNQHIQFFIS